MTLLPCLPTKGERRAEVANPRLDTCSREVFRHEVRVGGSRERETNPVSFSTGAEGLC